MGTLSSLEKNGALLEQGPSMVAGPLLVLDMAGVVGLGSFKVALIHTISYVIIYFIIQNSVV